MKVKLLRLVETEREQGRSVRETARLLGMSPQTIRDWKQRLREGTLDTAPRGRPVKRPDAEEHLRIDELLSVSHGLIGLHTLHRACPGTGRSTLARRRRRYVARLLRHREALTWCTPGAVWAADFTEAAAPIDGRFPHVLCVRDLASGMQLLSLPVDRATSAAAAEAIDRLCHLHGAPLVLKTDNGSHFKGDLGPVLHRHQVVQLFSPPCTPRYNGAIEASIGVHALLSGHMALANGHAGELTSRDIELARLAANEREPERRLDAAAARANDTGPAPADAEYPDSDACPGAPAPASPRTRWRTRVPITPDQRSAFLGAVAMATADETQALLRRRTERPKRRAAARAMRPDASPPGPGAPPTLDSTDRATVARRAIRRALLALGHLTARRPADISIQSPVVVHGN